MPRKNDQELVRLRQENETQRQQNESLLLKIDGLQKQLQQSLDGNAELKKQLNSLQETLDDLIFQLKDLRRQEHGPQTEHHNPRPAPALAQKETTASNENIDSSVNLKNKQPKEKRPRNHKKHINDQDLPSKPVVHSVKPEDLNCPHCLVETTFVTHEVTSQIERLMQSLARLEHMQEVRACPKCKQFVVTAQKPCPPIPGGYAGPCLLSSVVVDKFADALPNYRQVKRFLREHAIIPRSTQCDWVIASSLTIEPLYELLKRQVLASKVVQTDDSWIKIQDRKLKTKMRKGKITAYRGDKHHRYIAFDFSPDLSFDKNIDFLKDFKGFVQADAASGFDALFELGSGRTEIGCNAHSRRKYWQCNEAYEVICGEILDIYHQLYKTEKEIRDKEPAQRLAQRQHMSKPLTTKLEEMLLKLKDSLNPTNPLMKAVAYTLNHWDALTRFLDDPDFEIDNNACERAIKSFVLVRKNSLFVGSDAGGKAAAIHLSFIASCNNLNIDPLEYLTDVFTRINSMKMNELDQLLPDRWAAMRASQKAHNPPIKPPP